MVRDAGGAIRRGGRIIVAIEGGEALTDLKKRILVT
jgi:hypothetical protein